eukprot:g30484.t1
MCGKTLCWNRSLSLTASLTRSRLRPTASTIGGEGRLLGCSFVKTEFDSRAACLAVWSEGWRGVTATLWEAHAVVCVGGKEILYALAMASSSNCATLFVATEPLNHPWMLEGDSRVVSTHLLSAGLQEEEKADTCSLIDDFLEKGAWEVSMTLMSEAALALVEFDVAVYNAALSVLAGNDRWQATLQLRQRLQAAGLKETAGTVNPVAVAAGRGSSWASAVTALEELAH